MLDKDLHIMRAQKAILIIVLIGATYYMLCYSSASRYSIDLVSIYRVTGGLFSGITFDLEINITYNGVLPSTLSDVELAFYVDDINFGTKGFTESWEKFPVSSSRSYTFSSWGVYDEDDVDKLYNLDSHVITIKLKGVSKTSIVTSQIIKTYSRDWGF